VLARIGQPIRFDRPKEVAAETFAPEPSRQAAREDTTATFPAASSFDRENELWLATMLVKAHQVLQPAARVILLLALLTAAGLTYLMIENGPQLPSATQNYIPTPAETKSQTNAKRTVKAASKYAADHHTSEELGLRRRSRNTARGPADIQVGKEMAACATCEKLTPTGESIEPSASDLPVHREIAQKMESADEEGSFESRPPEPEFELSTPWPARAGDQQESKRSIDLPGSFPSTGKYPDTGHGHIVHHERRLPPIPYDQHPSVAELQGTIQALPQR
jgi:hypothetical protein